MDRITEEQNESIPAILLAWRFFKCRNNCPGFVKATIVVSLFLDVYWYVVYVSIAACGGLNRSYASVEQLNLSDLEIADLQSCQDILQYANLSVTYK